MLVARLELQARLDLVKVSTITLFWFLECIVKYGIEQYSNVTIPKSASFRAVGQCHLLISVSQKTRKECCERWRMKRTLTEDMINQKIFFRLYQSFSMPRTSLLPKLCVSTLIRIIRRRKSSNHTIPCTKRKKHENGRQFSFLCKQPSRHALWCILFHFQFYLWFWLQVFPVPASDEGNCKHGNRCGKPGSEIDSNWVQALEELDEVKRVVLRCSVAVSLAAFFLTATYTANLVRKETLMVHMATFLDPIRARDSPKESVVKVLCFKL